jgi:hypothetical protein
LKTQIKITTLSLIILIVGSFLNAQATNSNGNANDTSVVDASLLSCKPAVITVVSPANEVFDYTFLKGDVSDDLILLPIEEEITMKLVHS